MHKFLSANGLPNVRVKYLPDGSLKRCWRLEQPNTKWTEELAVKLNELGFTDFDHMPLGRFSGNGGEFQVSVRGHNELLIPVDVDAGDSPKGDKPCASSATES